MSELIQLNTKDIPIIREELLKEQSNKCKICNEEITENSGASLDHQHRNKKDIIGDDNGGLIRGVLCRACNVYEGKIWNNSARYGRGKTVQERILWLESLVEYYKSDVTNYIHPSEKPKEPKISKRNYNKLKKLYNESDRKAKFQEFPKSGKITKKLEILFNEFNINPYN